MKSHEIRAVARLGGMALGGAVAKAHGVHAAISDRVLTEIGTAIGPVPAPVRDVIETTTSAVYAAVGAALSLGSATAGEVLGTSEGERAAVDESRRARVALAVLNGAYGDLLEREIDELTLDMAVRVGGRDVRPEVDALSAAFPAAGDRIVVFVHGLVETEESWTYRSARYHGRPGVSYGTLLQRDLGYTPVVLRYNTGLRISENGRRLDALLAALVTGWPVPVREIVLVGHSMGGLVARSALAHAAARGRDRSQPQAGAPDDWPAAVRATVTLGSPHLGAPLEKGAAALTYALSTVSETRPLAAVLAQRSVGIKDLRHGNLLESDWSGHDPDALSNDRRPVPLHEGARHFVVLSTVLPESESAFGRLVGGAFGELLGDLMVRPASAAGRSGPLGLQLPAEQVHHVAGLQHLDLLNHPLIYQRLRMWLTK